MKFSNDEKKLAEFLFAHRSLGKQLINDDSTEANLKLFKIILVENVKDSKIYEKMRELLKYLNRLEYMPVLETWSVPVFPITGDHLASKNVPKGPIYTKVLNSLKEIWKYEYDFSTSEESVEKLLKKCDEILNK